MKKKKHIPLEEKVARLIAKLTKHDPSFENGWEMLRDNVLSRARALHASYRIEEHLIAPIRAATGGDSPAEEIVHRITSDQQVMSLLNDIAKEKRQIERPKLVEQPAVTQQDEAQQQQQEGVPNNA